MTSSSKGHFFFIVTLLQIIHATISYPAMSETSSLDNDAQISDVDYISSPLLQTLQRKKRAIIPPRPSLPPEVAAHMGIVVPRTFGYLHKPAVVYPIYYYPRYYIRVPRYYPSPKSELFRTNDAGNYINNLLPIFNKETPKVKEQIPALPSSPVTGNGGNGRRGGGLDNPLTANFPFWNQQANNWLWSDGVKTGPLPKADVIRTPNAPNQPQSTLFQLNLKDPKPIQFLHPAPVEDPTVSLTDVLFPASASDTNVVKTVVPVPSEIAPSAAPMP